MNIAAILVAPLDGLGDPWSWLDSMSFIQHLFGRHAHTGNPTVETVNWAGESGKEYGYKVYPLTMPFQSLPGNFIYAEHTADGSWVPIYIAQTRDLHQRLEGHVRVEDAQQHGATHIHAHYDSAGQAARCTEERDLILHWQPVCNEPLES